MTIKSVEKAISILNCFTSERKILSVKDMSRLTGLSISTTSRLLSTLKESGCVEKIQKNKKYQLGYRIYLWGKAIQNQINLVSIANPIMEELRDECGEEIALYIIEDNRRVCVERIESIHEIAKYGAVGTYYPIHAGAAGKVLLAFLSKDEQNEMLDKLFLEKVTFKTITDIDALKKSLNRIKKRGYAISHGEAIPDAFSVTAPIFNDKHQIVASISISGPEFRLTKNKTNNYVEKILVSAKKISLML